MSRNVQDAAASCYIREPPPTRPIREEDVTIRASTQYIIRNLSTDGSPFWRDLMNRKERQERDRTPNFNKKAVPTQGDFLLLTKVLKSKDPVTTLKKTKRIKNTYCCFPSRKSKDVLWEENVEAVYIPPTTPFEINQQKRILQLEKGTVKIVQGNLEKLSLELWLDNEIKGDALIQKIDKKFETEGPLVEIYVQPLDGDARNRDTKSCFKIKFKTSEKAETFVIKLKIARDYYLEGVVVPPTQKFGVSLDFIERNSEGGIAKCKFFNRIMETLYQNDRDLTVHKSVFVKSEKSLEMWKDKINYGEDVPILLNEEEDAQFTSNLLMLFLKNLPCRVIPIELNDEIIAQSERARNDRERVRSFERIVLDSLPLANFYLLVRIMLLAKSVLQNSATNEYNLESLAKELTPWLLSIESYDAESRLVLIKFITLLMQSSFEEVGPQRAPQPQAIINNEDEDEGVPQVIAEQEIEQV